MTNEKCEMRNGKSSVLLGFSKTTKHADRQECLSYQGEPMGRVYDALKRANTTEAGNVKSRQLHDSPPRGEIRTHAPVPSAKQIEEQIFSVSSILTAREDAVKSSAFTAHTANVSDGMALPEGKASRAVGATLDAARPARATGLVSYDIDPARVEPHLVAITQPRSAYCEQCRSRRASVDEAGYRGLVPSRVIARGGRVW